MPTVELTHPPVLGAREFRGLRDLLFEQAGIHLSDAKQTLVCGRLAKRLAARDIGDYADYLALVRTDADERQTAVDLLTTNETYFFREAQHFEFLARTLAPAWRGRSGVRVWCGACSTGEEPYSIAMTLAHALGHTRFEVLASDISTRVLDAARQALYPLDDAHAIAAPLRTAYCLKGVGPRDGWFRIDKSIRDRVNVQQINLVKPLPDVGEFDVIFLRNVMIYFSMPTKQQVVARLLPALRAGGHFIISHSESLHGVTDALRLVRPSIYRKD